MYVQIGKKSLYGDRFTPKVGVFAGQLLNYLEVNLPLNYNKVLLKSVKKSNHDLWILSNEVLINLY